MAAIWRVVLVMSLTPNRFSSAATAREAEGWVRPSSRAAFEKLPVSMVRTKSAQLLEPVVHANPAYLL